MIQPPSNGPITGAIKGAGLGKDVATRIVALMTGWYLQQSLIRSVGLDEFVDYGDRTVELLMAARHVW